jgi:hypothetical protein
MKDANRHSLEERKLLRLFLFFSDFFLLENAKLSVFIWLDK